MGAGRAYAIAREWHRVYAGCRAPCLRIEPAAHAPHHSTAPRAQSLAGVPGFLCCIPVKTEPQLAKFGKLRPAPSRAAGRTRRPLPSSTGQAERSTLARGRRPRPDPRMRNAQNARGVRNGPSDRSRPIKQSPARPPGAGRPLARGRRARRRRPRMLPG